MSVANGAYTRTTGFNQDDPDRIVPRFFIESIPDELASQREGHPIYRDQERVELMIPGISQYNIKVDIVTDEHRNRWPDQYKKFKQGIEISAEGTPLEQWPLIGRSQVLMLKAMNFTTVEQIAQMDDQTMGRIMGGMKLRANAMAFIDDAAAGALLAQSTSENERLHSEIAELRSKVEQLSGLLNQTHGQLQDMKNAPSPIATVIPGMSDPMELMKQSKVPQPPAPSSFDSLPAPRRGRKPLPRDAEGNIIRDQKVA